MQIICDGTLTILNINANFGGSTHDSFIWRNSEAKKFLRNIYERGKKGFWLSGDSGYPLEPFLMTPYNNPEKRSPEARYNYHHASAQNTVEKCISLLKMRFRSILKERTAKYTPRFVSDIVTCCAVLDNMCINNNVPLVRKVGDAEILADNVN